MISARHRRRLTPPASLQEAKGDKDQVPQMKQLCLNDPSGLTKNVKLPAEVRLLVLRQR